MAGSWAAEAMGSCQDQSPEMRVLEEARRVIRTEADALQTLADALDETFVRAVELVRQAKGRVIVTGIGKSGHVGQKIASTLASTGTPAFFLHPAEALHGDLGMIMRGDVVIVISKSGETDEVLRMLPTVRRLGASIIALTGISVSTLAREADLWLNISVKQEACPLGLAPTASTTATLALGDALALALLLARGFKEEDFALFHPGGSLGRRLLLRVEDLMHAGDAVPLVAVDQVMSEALFEITSKRLGVTGVLDEAGSLVGVITDGDLRRALGKGIDVLNCRASELMHPDPRRIGHGALAAKALQQMQQHAITSLFVFRTDEKARPVGIIHLHDLLKAGLA